MIIDEINDIKGDLMTLDTKYFPVLKMFIQFLKTNPEIRTKPKTKGKLLEAIEEAYK